MTAAVAADVAQASDTSALVSRPDALRRRLAEDGYLFLPALLPAEAIAGVHAEFAGTLRAAGWLDAGAGDRPGPEFGVDGGRVAAGEREVVRQLYRGEAFHALGHHPSLRALMEAVLDSEDVLVHPRPGCRVVFPPSPSPLSTPTPAHQDHLGMQGSIQTYTAWMPLAECGREMGPLAVAEGSHHGGLRPYRPQPGSRVAGCDQDELEGTWTSADFAPGDVLVFTSLTVHRALVNRSASLRLSADCRFQRSTDPVCEVSLREIGDLGFDDIYSAWQRDELKYYWRAMELSVVPFDPTLLRAAPAPPAVRERADI